MSPVALILIALYVGVAATRRHLLTAIGSPESKGTCIWLQTIGIFGTEAYASVMLYLLNVCNLCRIRMMIRQHLRQKPPSQVLCIEEQTRLHQESCNDLCPTLMMSLRSAQN